MKENLVDNISEICFGCEALGGEDWGEFNLLQIQEGIEKSLELGLNFFDTADVYGLGQSEKRLSEILGNRRHDFYIGTKGGIRWEKNNQSRATTYRDSSPEYIYQCVNQSLTRLRLDVLPIYYIHWPDPNTEISRTFEFLQKLVDQEKIMYLGCSNFNIDQIREASMVSNISYVQLPVNILNNPLSPAYSNFCKENSIRIIAYNALARGLLSGKYQEGISFNENDRRHRLEDFQKGNLKRNLKKIKTLKTAAEKEKLSLSQYSIKSVLGNENIESVIVGIKDKNQAIENIGWIN